MTTTAPAGTARPLPLASAGTPRTSTLWRQAQVLARRSLIKTWRTPAALIDVTLQPIIFLALFTYIFGGAIAGGSQDAYLQFLLPGLLGQTIAMASVSLGQNLNADIEKGVFDRFRSLPIARAAPLVGAVLSDIVRYVLLTVVTLGFGYILGFRADTSAPEVLAACLLAIAFALCLSWAAVFIGMMVRTPGAVQGIMFVILMPLTFATGIFVPVDTLPSWLEGFTKVNPMTHLVDALRGLMLGGGGVGTDVLWTVGWMAALLVVFVPLALRAYGRRV